MKNKFQVIIVAIVIAIISLFPIKIYAQEKNLVNIYLFHSSTCPHCEQEIKALHKIQKKYSNIKIYKYEIHTEKNMNYYESILQMYHLKSKNVPFIVVGDKYYIGYNENKTKLNIIKTIEYYSKYGYADRVAAIVHNNNLPTYKEKDNQISLDTFLKEYKNYQIIGNIYTNQLDIDTITILTSILTETNFLNIILLSLLIIALKRKKDYQTKLFLLATYLITYIITDIIMLINYNIIMWSIIVLILITYLFCIRKTKKNQIPYLSFTIIAILSNSLKYIVLNKYSNILKEVIKINNLSSFEQFIQCLIHLSIVIIAITIIIMLINLVLSKLGTMQK